MSRTHRAVIAAGLALAGLGAAGCGSQPEAQGNSARYCDGHAAVDESFANMPNQTLEELRDGIEAIASDAEALTFDAPSEIREEARVVARTFEELSDTARSAPNREAVETAAMRVGENGEYTAAAETIDEWVAENCPEE